MFKFMGKKMNNKKGFTLIELIVVIAILGILAAIAVPRFAGFNDKANAAAMTADARTIMTAAQTILAEDPDAQVTDAKIKELAGALKGTVTWTGQGSEISFKYDTDEWTVTCTDGTIGTPTKKSN